MQTTRFFFSTLGILTFASIFIFSISKCSNFESKKDLSSIKKTGVLHIVSCNTNHLQEKNDSNANCFQYELLKIIANELNLELVIHTEDKLENAIKNLRKGKYDLIIQNVIVTKELRKKINFTKTISYNKQVLIQRKSDSLIKDLYHLHNKTIYAKKESPGYTRATNLAEELGISMNIIAIDKTDTDILKLVSSGKIDYAICNQRTAKAKKIKNLHYKTPVGFTQIEAWGLRKNAYELESTLNHLLDSIKQTDEYWEIHRKYY